MKKLNKVAMLIASVAFAAAASAQPVSPANPAQAANGGNVIDNWQSGSSQVWVNGTGEHCWRDANWTPATAAVGCDGALVVAQKETVAPPPPVAAPDQPPPAPQVQKVSYSADTFFDFDKAVLKPAGKEALDELVRKIADIDLEVIVAVGHTDWIGTAEYNMALSLRRSEAVKAYLVSQGVDAGRIYTEGKGKTQPIADNRTREGRALNRRVEIEVVGTRTVPAN